MNRLTAAKKALIGRLKCLDKEFRIRGRFRYILPLEAVEILKNGWAKENHRYVFQFGNGFASLYDGYSILASKTMKEDKYTYLIYLFVGHWENEQHNRRIEYIRRLIFDNPRKYNGGYVGMFQYLGFYDFEPVTLGKDGKIRKIYNCTPIENLLRYNT